MGRVIKQLLGMLGKVSGGRFMQKRIDLINSIFLKNKEVDRPRSATVQAEMRVSAAGIQLICAFEGKQLVAYDDGVGVWTIGFGTTIYPNQHKVKKGDRCSDAQATQYMQHDLNKFEHAVNKMVTVPLTQNQFDALVSLSYNIGIGALRNATLLKKLNSGDYQAAANQFDVWINAGGKRVQGLVNRRAREKKLFLK